MYNFLDGVNSPNDIKKLNIKELEILAKDIRKFLVKNVSNTGGHLASNLGVVELTLALHKVFECPKDKFVWDVGHQTYVHKIITGRKRNFSTLRQYKGLSGFPKECESEYDMFDTGHSSTSVSAGLGMAVARDIKNEDYDVISIIGDGAFTGGMAMEAMNNLGFLKKNMVVVFNDNEMSIDKNTGAFSAYMSKIIHNTDTLSFKDRIDKIMNMTQVGGKISQKANKLTETLISSISPQECGLIDAMGIRYIGPIDGHDLSELIETFECLKYIDGPKFVHIKTVKGKGYKYAELTPEKYHGVGKFDYKVGVESSSKRSISAVVGQTLSQMAGYNDKIVAITAAMPSGTGLNYFEERHPNRYFDVGIAEQHAVTFAAGLSKMGMKPYFAVYSTFLQRAYDQLIHDVSINSRPVTFLIDRAGLVGNDGETHHGQFDLSYLNPIPNITVMAPKDTEELINMIKLSERIDSTVAIRYPRGNEYKFEASKYEFIDEYESEELSYYTIGKPEKIYDVFIDSTKRVCIFSIGNMLDDVCQAVANILKTSDDYSFKIYNARYLKPMDEEIYINAIQDADIVISVEDNVKTGGFSSNIEKIMSENNVYKELIKIAIPDAFVAHGSVDELKEEIGLSSRAIEKAISGIKSNI
ncbi:1-deoxy-D-xylulose-5-phosphate synthase [Peptostreptococcus equinus]|uniref:1-deoxy-D-xylulose-5-phosphate synthase n=1 Tax=Peptostreptococcus equinus TaxID=3003601 RepID=A0ABY7JRZ4_9FIRM|nr:1-deoxy-D-xylulose-5-phosphate synthase [Peptostreptococcus sp. CBA3647]WAW15621.1 1-deoxy-D-xylulose-5-phosphate synthase [Peptostreptococcus sp. CBA3647]